MLEMGRVLTHDEEVSHFGLWCMMSSPLLIGCDLTKIPAETDNAHLNNRGHDLFLPIGEKFILDHLNH